MVVYFQLISGRARSNKHFKLDITKIVLWEAREADSFNPNEAGEP